MSESGLDVASAFGEASEAVTIGGRQWFPRELDLNDIIILQQRIGGVESLDSSNIEHMRLLFWLILRKSDPALTPEQRENDEYPLTETQAGKMVKFSDLRNPGLVDTLLKRSGFIPESTGDAGNAPAGEAEAETPGEQVPPPSPSPA